MNEHQQNCGENDVARKVPSSIVAVQFESRWEEGNVTTPAKLDLDTGIVFDIEASSDGDHYESLIGEYVLIGDREIGVELEPDDNYRLDAVTLAAVRAEVGQRKLVEWPSEHSDAAVREGWDIWDSEGSENGRWQVQRIDDPEAFAEAAGFTPPKLASDDDAFRIVANGTQPHHIAARDFLKDHNQKEYNAVMRFADRKLAYGAEYYVWCEGSCDNKTADPAEALRWAGEFRSEGRDDVYIVDVDNNVIDESEFRKLAAADVDVIEVAMLDSDHAAKFSKPWLCQHEDGRIVEFDTEDEACSYQREHRKHRKQNGMDAVTGEPIGRKVVDRLTQDVLQGLREFYPSAVDHHSGELSKVAAAAFANSGNSQQDYEAMRDAVERTINSGSLERKLSETTKIRLTFDVVYTPNGTAVEELKENLESVARLAVNEGMLTGGTEAEVEDYQFEVVASPSVSQDVGAATLFWRELSESVETLTELADQHGPRTLADLMYLQNAILSGGFIDHYPDESDALEVLKALPSADRWLQFVKIEELENENDSPAPGK